MLENLPVEPALVVAILVIVASGALMLIIRRLRRRADRQLGTQQDAGVDIALLDAEGPPEGYPRLEFYGTPVRLKVMVVAPCGRGSELPPPDLLPGLMERLIPGLTSVVAVHQPIVRRWSQQLSVHGFHQSFFQKVALPGSAGKGTPWCSAAGRLSLGQHQFLIGMVFVSNRANGFVQIVVEHEGQWLNTIRVREQEA